MIRQQAIEAQLALRERPANDAPVMKQRWDRLLFLHWQADAEELARHLPPGLALDLFDGKAWIAVVPFYMRRVRPVGLPSLPWLSNFLELNVRTYVVDENGRPGVWFFSLDTDRWIARTIARSFFKLPYFWASMAAGESADAWTDYRVKRRGQSEIASYRYRGSGEARLAEEGSFEFFLLERYLLYAWDRRRQRLLRGRVWHEPYRFRDAEVSQWSAAPIAWDTLSLPVGEAHHQCFVDRVDVDAFAVEKVD